MQKQVLINSISILVGILFLTACEYTVIKPEPVNPNDTVSFSLNVQPIFERCNGAGCHVGSGPKPDLAPANAYKSLMDNGFVIPSNGAGSILYTCLQAGGVMAAYGNTKDNGTIKTWIDQGAKNN
ncbi:MAG: hypothetical protein WCO93_02795 [bacterium]